MTAVQVGRAAQQGAHNAQANLSRFVEGHDGPGPGTRRTGSGLDEDKRAFWDDFASTADHRSGPGGSVGDGVRSSAIGTSAMGRTNMGAAAGQGKPQQQKDEWDDW